MPTHDQLELVKDWIVIIGFPLTIFGVLLAMRQYQKARKWNKLNSAFSLFGAKQYGEFLDATHRELDRLKIELHGASSLTEQECARISADVVAYGAVRGLLNYFEDYSTALHYGVMHKEMAFNLMGEIMVQHYIRFEPFIKTRRDFTKSIDLWTQFELAAKIFAQEFEGAKQKEIRDLLKKLKSLGY